MSMREIYRKVARKHHVSVDEVKKEMQTAIDEAWTASKDDAVLQKRQQAVSCKGEVPTNEEFIRYAAKELCKQQSVRNEY